MSTLYKPIVVSPESAWSNPAKAISYEVFENRAQILKSLNFHEEHGHLGDGGGKFDDSIVRAENELLNEIAGILTFAAAQAVEIKVGVAIATLAWVRKNPSSAQSRTLPGFVEWLLADHYQRTDESKATYFPDIMGFVPDGFAGKMAIADENSIINAASAAINQLGQNRSAGRPFSEASRVVAVGLRPIFLRYNAKITRHFETSWRDGEFKQIAAGPYFDFVSAAIAPLQKFLLERDLNEVSVDKIVRLGRYPISSITNRFNTKTLDGPTPDMWHSATTENDNGQPRQ